MLRPDYAFIFFTIIFSLALAMCIPQRATPRELYPGQYSQVSPEVQQWFRSQKVPAGPNEGMSCCNEADGVYAEMDIINGRYWTRWRINGALTAWLPVPDNAVLPKNRNGSAVVFWNYKDGQPNILCFAPGTLV